MSSVGSDAERLTGYGSDTRGLFTPQRHLLDILRDNNAVRFIAQNIRVTPIPICIISKLFTVLSPHFFDQFPYLQSVWLKSKHIDLSQQG